MNEFQEQILDHYKNPRNSGRPEWKSDKVSSSENLSCGDKITMYLLLEDEKVKDVKFEGEGCSICIASASLLTDEIKGKELEEINKIKEDDILEFIGIELSPSRVKCAILSLDALRGAI